MLGVQVGAQHFLSFTLLVDSCQTLTSFVSLSARSPVNSSQAPRCGTVTSSLHFASLEEKMAPATEPTQSAKEEWNGLNVLESTRRWLDKEGWNPMMASRGQISRSGLGILHHLAKCSKRHPVQEVFESLIKLIPSSAWSQHHTEAKARRCTCSWTARPTHGLRTREPILHGASTRTRPTLRLKVGVANLRHRPGFDGDAI